MQRFLALARWILTAIGWIATVIFIPIFTAVVARFIWEQPLEAANVVSKFLHYLSEQTWLGAAALFLGGFVAGFWLDWLRRKLDGSRADTIKLFGAEMVRLGNYLEQLKSPMQESARIRSCFATAKRLGLWVPDERIFRFHPPRASHEISNYLKQVGTMLKDGNFREANEHAMRLIRITAAACLVLTAPAFGNEYQCSPYSGACVPLSSQPSVIDQPSIVYPRERVWPRLCDPDGPNSWSCSSSERPQGRQRERTR
jgi:hypothetical protein